MKITLLQEKLKEGLLAVERISSKSFSLPILNNILLTASKNFICLEATNLEIGLRWWILAKTEKEGKVSIPSNLFSNFISFLPNEKIEIQDVDLILRINNKNQNTQIKCFPHEDFPIIPQIKEEKLTSINSRSFCEGLNQIINIPTPSSSRPEISGIYFLLQKGQLIIAATDSFRLGERKIPLGSFQGKDYSFILPLKTSREIVSIFGERDGDINLFLSSNQIMFEFLMEEITHPKIQLISRLIEGEYPNYQEIIPKKFETKMLFKRDDFIEQIKLASLFSKKTNELNLKIDSKNQKAVIFSQNQDIGEHVSDLSAKIEGGPIELSFNYKFLLDGLLSIKSPEVVFELSGGEGAGVLKPNNSTENYLYVVMPMRGG